MEDKSLGRNISREDELSKIMNDLKNLSINLEVPVIITSQLKRELETRTNKRPMLSDIRDSEAIENRADLIAFIFFTPDAREFVLAKWAELEEYVMEGLAPHQVYPLEAEYTVIRGIDLWNNGSGVGHLEESIPLPSDVSSDELGPVALAFNDGTEVEKSNIQKILAWSCV